MILGRSSLQARRRVTILTTPTPPDGDVRSACGAACTSRAILAGACAGLLLLGLSQRLRADETLWDALLSVAASNASAPSGAQPPGGPASASGASPEAVQPNRPRRNPIRMLGSLQSWLQGLGTQTKSEIKVNGQHSLRYHMESVAGSRDSYDNAMYYGRRGMGGYTDTDLTITGKLLGLVSFETHYTDSAYGMPYDNRLKLSYATKTFTVEAGDIQAGVAGNSLVDFSRSLKGVTIAATLASGVKLSTLYSQEKAQTRTIVINGANRSGPYYVFAGQVVDGSARVRINNRDMILGQDYTLDPYTGELNFLNGLIVNELETIAVTFETYGYNQSPGLLTGWRADVTAIKPIRFGFTYLSQLSNRGGTRLQTKTEQFYGYNSAATPYVLEMPVEVTLIRDEDGKITGAIPVYPMTVTVSGLPQAYGTDYVLDPLLTNRLYFKMAIPSTQIIKVVYTPLSTGDTSGDRSVVGFDINTSLGKVGTVTAEMATSSLRMTGEGAGGSAWQIRSDMKFARDKLRLNWTLKNIGADFTAVQSPGFRRNDRGISLTADYEASSKLKLNATAERMRRPAYSYAISSTGASGLSQSVGLDDYNQMSFRANWQLGKGGVLSLNHNDMRTILGAGGRSAYLTDTLAYQQTLGQVSLDASLGRQNSSTRATYAQSGSGGTSQPTTFGSDSLNARLSAKWRLGERLSFDTALTNSSMRSADGKRNTAQDISFTARSTPLQGLTVGLGYQYQTSGGYSLFSGYTDYGAGVGTYSAAATRQVGTIGYTGGGISGYYGGGVNSGLGGYGNYSGGFTGGTYGLGSASFGGNNRGLNLTVNYQPWPTLTVDLNYMNGSSVGDYLFNSKRSALSFNTTYNPGQRLSLVGGAMFQNVAYVGSTGGTTTSTLYLNAQARPWGKLITSMNVNYMRSNTRAAATGDTGQTGSDQTGSGYYGSGYGSYFGSGSTDLSSYGLRLEYPVWMASNLFLQWDSADSAGYLASIQRTLSFGLAFDLGNNTQFQLGWRDQKYNSKALAGGSDYSYHVRSLDADLGLRF